MPIPLRSDRSAWDTVGYANLHARDLENGQPTVHLPAAAGAGQVALWNGTRWVTVPLEVSELLDVDMTGVQDGHVLIYDLVSGKWLTGPMTGGSGSGGGGGDPVWTVEGRLAAHAGIGGPILITRSCTLQNIYVYLRAAGDSGATVIDVNLNGSTLLNAPISVPIDDADHIIKVTPAVTDLAENDILSLDIDAAAPGAADLVVLLALQIEESGGAVSLRVAEEGTLLPARSAINFIGAEITATDDADNDRTNVTLVIPTPEPEPQTISVQNKSSQLTARGRINFLGSLVNAVDDAANDRINVTISDPVIPMVTQQVIFTVESDVELKVGTLKIVNHTGSAKTISAVYLDIGTPPAGSALIVDINNNGVSIFTAGNRPQIASGANAGSSSTIASPAWADGQALTMDVDQIGSGTAGADLTVTIVYSQEEA